MTKKIGILGSTGSIGVQTLEVIAAAQDSRIGCRSEDSFEVVSLSAGSNLQLLLEQIKKFKPKLVSVVTEDLAREIRAQYPQLEVSWGEQGLLDVATHPDIELLVSALVGAIGIKPTLAAISAKKDIALANKEVLVAAGPVVMEEVKKHQVKLLPVDSEHSAIFQVLEPENFSNIKKIILTASGGPFLNRSYETFSQITPEEALKHPRWSMGQRISIDSATLMNKGFEVIEAFWLFDLSPSQIEVVVHPEAIIHSLVSYRDGNTLGCLSVPDMKAPISYALSYPKRISTEVVSLDLVKVKSLTFSEPDFHKFPLLKLAFDVMKEAGVKPAILNAADEVAVEAFLKRKISFDQIHQMVERTLNAYTETFPVTLESILEADKWARRTAAALI